MNLAALFAWALAHWLLGVGLAFIAIAAVGLVIGLRGLSRSLEAMDP